MRSSFVFLQTLGAISSWIFLKYLEILPKFSCILPRFLTNQNFWRCACTPRNGTVRRWNVKCIFLWNVTKVQISHCRREACRRKIRSSTCNRTAMRAVYPNVHALIKSMLTISCTTASFNALSIKMAVLQIYLRNYCGEERLNCNCSDYFVS